MKKYDYRHLFAGFTPLTQGLEQVGNNRLGTALSEGNLGSFLQAAFDVAIVVGAMLAVLQIGRAGVLYMTGDIISNKSRAKEMLQDAVLGLVVLISIVLILKQINPNILKLDFTATPVSTQGENTGFSEDQIRAANEEYERVQEAQRGMFY